MSALFTGLVPLSGFRLRAGLVTINTAGGKGLYLYSHTAWVRISVLHCLSVQLLAKGFPSLCVAQCPHSVALGPNGLAYLKCLAPDLVKVGAQGMSVLVSAAV